MTYLRIAAFDVLLLATGTCLLYGLGLVRSGGDALRHAGLALLTGWAALGVALSLALVAGAPLPVWLVTLVAVAVALAGLALGRRVGTRRLPAVAERGTGTWVAVAGAAVVVVHLAALLRRSLEAGAATEWDAWGFWLAKARTIVEFGGLDTAEGGFTSFANAHYPPLFPALEASVFSFVGSTDGAPLAFHHWLVAAAFLAGLASLLAVRVRPALLWPSLALLALLPSFTDLIGTSIGDEALMLLVPLAALCAALWLLEGDGRYAALAGLFLAAAALTKSEGLAIALLLAAVTFVAAVARRPRRPVVPALLVLAPVVALVPWRVWRAVHGVATQTDYRPSDLLRPSVLLAKVDRLEYAARALPEYLFDPDRWLLALPLMLAAAVLAAPRRPGLVALAVTPAVAVPVGLLIVYWTGIPPVDWYVASSAGRITASAVVASAVFLPLLLAEASRREARSR